MKKKWRERIIALSLMGGSLYLGWLARDFPLDGGFFPLFSLACIFLLSVYLFTLSFFPEQGIKEERDKEKKSFHYKPFILFGILILQILLIKKIGYFVSTALFLAAASLFLGIRNYRILLFTILILIPAMYLFFVWGLQANLPRGILF